MDRKKRLNHHGYSSVLTVVDTLSRFASAVHAPFSYRAEDVVATLDQACAEVVRPSTV
ncbi:MAG: hypothetical protein AAF416_11640 [Pseudomonadota bacterium]